MGVWWEKSVQLRSWSWLTLGLVLLIGFQNCDGGFRYDPKTTQLSSLDYGTAGVGDARLRLVTLAPDSTAAFPEGSSLESGKSYQLRAIGPDLSGTVMQFSLSNNEPVGNCLLKPATTPEARFIECTRSGRVSVRLSVAWPDGSISVLTSERTTSVPYVDPCGGNVETRRVFRIPQGTGNSPWNSMTQPVKVFVGQTLRVCNDDESLKSLMTNGTPCAAQSQPMGTGEFYDCVVSTLSGADAAGNISGLYNALVGPAAPFYVRGFDGPALYRDGSKTRNGQSCASCHGANASSSEKRNRTVQQIRNAIDGNAGGMGIYKDANNTYLISDDELEAIAYSLKN